MSEKNPLLVKIAYGLVGDHYSVFLPNHISFQFSFDGISEKTLNALDKTMDIYRRKKGEEEFDRNSMTVYSVHGSIAILIMVEKESILVLEFNKNGDIKLFKGFTNAYEVVAGVALLPLPIAEFLTDECSLYECLEKLIDLKVKPDNIEIAKTEDTITMTLPLKDNIVESYLKLTVNSETETVCIERKHTTDTTKLEYTEQTKDLLTLYKEIYTFNH